MEIERALNYLAPTHVAQDTVLLNALKVLKERTNALGPSGAARRDPPSLAFVLSRASVARLAPP